MKNFSEINSVEDLFVGFNLPQRELRDKHLSIKINKFFIFNNFTQHIRKYLIAYLNFRDTPNIHTMNKYNEARLYLKPRTLKRVHYLIKNQK